MLSGYHRRPLLLTSTQLHSGSTFILTCAVPHPNTPRSTPQLLPAGLPGAGAEHPAGGGGAEASDAPRNAKYDPLWARRAAATLMESQGLKVVEVQQTVTELRKTQAAVGRSLAEVRAAAGARGSGGGGGGRGRSSVRACERCSVNCAFASSRLTH